MVWSWGKVILKKRIMISKIDISLRIDFKKSMHLSLVLVMRRWWRHWHGNSSCVLSWCRLRCWCWCLGRYKAAAAAPSAPLTYSLQLAAQPPPHCLHWHHCTTTGTTGDNGDNGEGEHSPDQQPGARSSPRYLHLHIHTEILCWWCGLGWYPSIYQCIAL